MTSTNLQTRSLRPFLSILMIIGTLLCIVFVKMEIRRTGYSVLKLSREKRMLVAEKTAEDIQFARLTRPDRVERYAHDHLDLKRAHRDQVIQITGPHIVLRE